ncbi:MAG TPA: aspartate carbamoyltransferase [Spirochaetota bacterium]|nr:aspartate carbamoyltransferase [Spirochaetota bacterium]
MVNIKKKLRGINGGSMFSQKLRNLDWKKFQALPTHKRKEYFAKDGRIFDVLFSQQFSRATLDLLYRIINKVRHIHKTKDGAKWLSSLLSTKKAMLYFTQPSTRTYLSFVTACQTLGIQTADVRSSQTSSEMKGETFEDTIQTFSSYFDVIIMRNPHEGHAEKASFVLNNTLRPIPIINAGSGKDQHPTQALLDIYTLQKSFSDVGGLDNKTIMMVGDLKRGRTVHSLSYLLTNYNKMKIILSSPEQFRMGTEITEFLKINNIELLETTEFKKFLPDADAVYMTRIQDEHDTNNESSSYDKKKYTIDQEALKDIKPTSFILHPLPRIFEIKREVDKDPRAIYWRQVRNGMWARVALLIYLFRLEEKIFDR